MKHIVITVGCEYGSGGPAIGKMLADSLGIAFYDRDLVDKIVDELGVAPDLVEKADTAKNVKYSFETKLGPRYASLTNRVIYMQFEVIKKLAEKTSCVIIGRCSDYILKDQDDCLNVFIYAPDEVRIENIRKNKNVSQNEAKEMMKYNDHMLHARYKYMTGTYRGDRHNRDILIDSSMLGLEMTAKYLLDLVHLRFGDC